MSAPRQQVLHLWLSSPALDSNVIGWAFYDGTAGVGPVPEGDPPYPNGLAALVEGWYLLQVSPLWPASPGQERETSFLNHEFVFTRVLGHPT